MRLLSIAIFTLVCCQISQAQRNEEEEAKCQRLLTQPDYSPLVPHLKRNLKFDEDGEFACEVVLQDRDMPAQIRFTIHEGLSLLATRHVEMGLRRQKTIARHLGLMSEMLPGAFDFSFRAGVWCMDPAVSDPNKAVKHFRNVLYGRAANDTRRQVADVYTARYEYIRALGQIGELKEAKKELQVLLSEYPLDFDSMAHLLSEGNPLAVSEGLDFTVDRDEPEPSEAIQAALDTFRDAYSAIASLATNEYAGFTPPTAAWTPHRFTELPSEEVFLGYVQRREPFLVSFGDSKRLCESLHWQAGKWLSSAFGAEYMKTQVSEDEEVLVEVKAPAASTTTAAAAATPFGFGLGVRRKFANFHDLLSDDFTDKEGNQLYLNIQMPGTLNQEHYAPPLDSLAGDIPPPIAMLGAALWSSNVSEVNLWLGHARGGDAQSRLHFDATDNLYVVLEGRKAFALLPPSSALRAHTLSPTIAVSPDGMAFQFNPNKFRAYFSAHYKPQQQQQQQLLSKVDMDGNVLDSTTSDDHSSSHHWIDDLLHNNVTYGGTSDYHFSTINATAAAAATTTAGSDAVEGSEMVHFDVLAGDMLYLPTGWFHQVTSREGRHMAVNYWWRALHWRAAQEYERQASERVYDQLIEQYRQSKSGAI